MEEHDKIASRLSMLLMKLNSGEKVSIEALAEEFNVSARTVQRDIYERFSYMPIKKENGLFFLESYAVGKLNFEDIKNFATISGIKELYPNLSQDFITDILDSKIGAYTLVKTNSFEDISTKTLEYQTIGLAITEHKQLHYEYSGRQRVVNPYKLVNINAIWYLVGDEEGVLKNYAFTKISKLTLTDTHFEINQELTNIIDRNEAQWFSQKQIKVILEIDIKISEYFLRRKLLPYQTVIKQDAQKLTLSAKISYDEEILKLVRYWIPHVKIISPTYLQEKLNEELMQYLNQFQTRDTT